MRCSLSVLTYLLFICTGTFVWHSALFSPPAPLQNASLPGRHCYSNFNCYVNVNGKYGGRRHANRKSYRITLSMSENYPMKDSRCSKTALDCLPLTLWNSPFSKSDDRSKSARRNGEKFSFTRQDNKGTSAPLLRDQECCPLRPRAPASLCKALEFPKLEFQ